MNISTDTRIFQVTTFEGETHLCNLEHIEVINKQLMFKGDPIKSIKHYWNHKFQHISKIDVKEMKTLNR